MKLKIALSLFTPAELKELGKLLDAEIFGNQAAIATCFHACVALMRTGNDWTEAELSRALFPTKKPADNIQYLRTRTSALMRALEAYLSWKTFQQDPVLQASCLVTALNQRGWESGYRHAYSAAMDMIDQAPLRGFGHYAARVELVEGYHIAQGMRGHRDKGVIFQDSLASLDRAYILKLLGVECLAAGHDRIQQTQHSLKPVAEIEAWIHLAGLAHDPIVCLHLNLRKMSNEPSKVTDGFYFEAKQAFFHVASEMLNQSLQETQDIFAQLINYAIIRHNQAEKSFTLEIVSLYKSAIEDKIILVNGEIRPHHFINAVSAFIFAGDRQAAYWILEKFGHKIKGDAAIATRNHCMGYLSFSEGNYEKAYDNLWKALHAPPKEKHPQFEVEIRGQLARVSYLLKETQEAATQVKTILNLIREKWQLDEEKANSYKLFSEFMLQLCRISHAKKNTQAKAIQNLEKKFSNIKQRFFASNWFGKQIEEYKIRIASR